MIRVPLRLALLGIVFALLAGAFCAPVLLPGLTMSAEKAQAQAAATSTPTATSTAAPTQTPYIIVQSPTPLPATAAPSATATPLPPGYGPDSCEPNDTLVQPCSIATEVELGNLNFSDGTPDVYSVLLKANRTYTISARSQSGVDPVITVFLAGATDKPVASNDDIGPGDNSAAVQVVTTGDGWYIVLVENKAPGDMRGKTYSFSTKSAATPGSQSTPPSDPNAAGDALENNYDTAHASRIVWGVPYDLSLVCPDPTPGACGGGDHDFILVPTKAGIPLVAMTYDLGPGADTNLVIYRPDALQTADGGGAISGWKAIAGNDDVAPGYTLRSTVRLTPDWTGEALLIVSSSERANPPALPAALGPVGRYRLIAGPPEMKAVAAVLTAQTDAPATPTPVAASGVGNGGGDTSAPSVPPPAPPAEIIKEASMTGIAELSQATDLYGAVPPGPSDKLAHYPKGTKVKLLGQSYRGWVKVQPADAVTPGWMWGPALKPVEVAGADPGPTAVPATTPAPGGTAVPGATAGTPVPTPPVSSRAATIELLEPEPIPPAEPSRPVARALNIEVCLAAPDGGRGCGQPIAGLHIEVRLAANLAVQVQGVTDPAGKVTLSTSVPAGTRLILAIPVVGIAAPIADDATDVPVRVPSTLGGNQ